MRFILILLITVFVATSCKKNSSQNPEPEIFQFPEGLLAAIGLGHTDTVAVRWSNGSYNIVPYSYTCNSNYACNFDRTRDRIIVQPQSGNVVHLKRTGGNGDYLKYNVSLGADWDNPGQYIMKKTIGFTTQLSDSTKFVLTKSPNSNNFSLEPEMARGNFLRIGYRQVGSGSQGTIDFVPAGTENTIVAF